MPGKPSTPSSAPQNLTIGLLTHRHQPACAGLWQFELNNEAVTGKTSQIRSKLKLKAAKALHDVLAPALKLPVPAVGPDKAAVDAMAYQEARAAAIGATVALGLAGDGPELQRMVHLAPALAPADDSLLDILQHITTMPPGPGYDALVQLLESRSQVRPCGPFKLSSVKRHQSTLSAPIGVAPLSLISKEQDQA